MNLTQKHICIIRELENKDVDIVMRPYPPLIWQTTDNTLMKGDEVIRRGKKFDGLLFFNIWYHQSRIWLQSRYSQRNGSRLAIFR